MNMNSTLATWIPRVTPWRQRIFLGVGVAFCVLFRSTTIPRSFDDSQRRSLLSTSFFSRAHEDSVEESDVLPTPFFTTNGQTVTSFLIPPNPSPVPKQRVYNGIGIDSQEKEDSMDFLKNCKITSQVRLIASSPKWVLQSMDEQGVDKFVGGDEFYITYTDSNKPSKVESTAVAHVTDLKNGRYELDFVTTPMDPTPDNLSGTGLLRIYFQYSCGIGFLPPPTKVDWNIGGTSSFFAKVDNIQQPPIRIFQYRSLGDICFRGPQFDKLIGVGDSVLNNFVRNKWVRIPGTFKGKLTGPLTPANVQEKVVFIEKEFGKYIRIHHHRVVLLVGSSTWDIIHNDESDDFFFEDHFKAVRTYIHKLQMHFPTTTLVWSAPNALHVHRVTCRGEYYCSLRTKYLSTSRAEFLYQGQKQIMEELGVLFLDTYEAYYLSAEWTEKNDGRHFDHELTGKMLHWYYDQNDCSIGNATAIVS